MIDARATIQQRLEKLEHEILDLRSQLARLAPPPQPDWLDHLMGSVTDEAAFREALEFGRAVRSADRPRDADEPRP